MKQYTWRFDKLSALLVAFTNVLLSIYISYRFLSDAYFLKTQLGFSVSRELMLVMVICLISMTCYLNYKFIRKHHLSRLFLSLCETICLASIIRNIFIGHMYFGFGYSSYVRNIVSFVIVSFVIYHTMFSNQIQIYFQEKRT